LTQRNAATFSKQLTTSDEAFTQWYIMVTYDEIQEGVNRFKAGKENEKDSFESESQKKGTKSGEHLIKKHGEQYVQLYQSQCNLRTKENHVYRCWEGVFFDKYFFHAQTNSPTSKKHRREISNDDPFEGIAYRKDFD
jgi:hypothetical protein